MRRAQLFDRGSPVGAVIVYNGVIIARDHNRVEAKKDCTSHAEILCMRRAMQVIGDWRLTSATLYTTLEPCSMCAGAIILSRIPRLVWGLQIFDMALVVLAWTYFLLCALYIRWMLYQGYVQVNPHNY